MEKIKQFIGSDKGRDVLLVLIIILVGLGSFQLGRLSKGSGNGSSGLKIEYSGIESLEKQANVVLATEPSEKAFFASKRGSKYYPAGCPAGANLKPENRVYFPTNTAAEDAGYELSTSCK